MTDSSKPPAAKDASDQRHDGPARTSPYAVSRLSGPVGLVDAAKEIAQADVVVGAVVSNQLNVIVEQIRALQEQAQAVLDDARVSADLHRAECAFKKKVGRLYHLYERPDGSRYFSMLSPIDWNDAPPHTPVGSYRLEPDMSWTPIEKLAAREDRDAMLQKIVGANIAKLGSGAK